MLNCLSPSHGAAGNKNKVHCKVMLDRGGYVPGENVLLSAKVVNQSPLKIKGTRLCLTETIEYFMHKKKTRTERRDLVVIKRGKIRPFTMDELNEKIYIPPLPPTNLQGCHLISITYDVFVSITSLLCLLTRFGDLMDKMFPRSSSSNRSRIWTSQLSCKYR